MATASHLGANIKMPNRNDQLATSIGNNNLVSKNLNNHDDNPYQNAPHQNDTWIGDKIADPKPCHTLRILFQNVNNIGSRFIAQNTATIISDQLCTKIDILGMTEHCVNMLFCDTLHQIQSGIKHQITEKTTLQINSSNLHTETPYLPGGTAVSITGNTVGRLKPNGRGGDAMEMDELYNIMTQKSKANHNIFGISSQRPTNERYWNSCMAPTTTLP